jgi:hypothetical protein
VPSHADRCLTSVFVKESHRSRPHQHQYQYQHQLGDNNASTWSSCCHIDIGHVTHTSNRRMPPSRPALQAQFTRVTMATRWSSAYVRSTGHAATCLLVPLKSPPTTACADQFCCYMFKAMSRNAMHKIRMIICVKHPSKTTSTTRRRSRLRRLKTKRRSSSHTLDQTFTDRRCHRRIINYSSMVDADDFTVMGRQRVEYDIELIY